MERLRFAGGLVIVALVAALLAPLISPTLAQSLIETVDVGDNPGATLADPTRNLVYVLCDYDDTIHVIDGSSNTVVRTIPLSYNASGAVLDPVANRLYVASCSPIHVLDAATGNELGTIQDCVFHAEDFAIDPERHRLLISDESGLIGVSDYVNIYDTTTLQRVARVEIGYSSAFRDVAVALNPVTGMGYASYEIDPGLTLFDVRSGEIKGRVNGLDTPQSVAADPVRNRVYVRCRNEIAVFDGTTAARVGSIPVAGLMGLNTSAGRVYSWKRTDLHVFDANTFTEVGSVRIPGIGYAGYYASIAVLETLGRVYCPMTYNDGVAVIQDVAAGPTSTPGPPTATPSPTQTSTVAPSSTPTCTASPGPSPTPTQTRTPGPVDMYLPLIRKVFPVPTPTPTATTTLTPTPTPEWQGRPDDGLWQGQTITEGHSDKPQTLSFGTANGGSKIRAGMDLVTYVSESNFWICYGTATWEIAVSVPIARDGTFTFSRSYLDGSISGTGHCVSPSRCEGTYATDVMYGVCGNIHNTGTWWAAWQGPAALEASELAGAGELRLDMRER